MNYWKAADGEPFPLGATWNNTLQGFNFALYSKEASAVSLHFFKKDTPGQEVATLPLNPAIHRTGSIWHCFIPDTQLAGADSYAYRVNGAATAGNHFDAQKLLSDPWAKAVFLPPAFSRQAATAPGDNTARAPLALLIRQDANPPGFEHDKGPKHYHDLIIYEMHVKGFTAHNSSSLSDQLRGTFAGVIAKIPYLKELGVTAVELMPVFQFDPKENNYWGYMTLNFFSPHAPFGAATDSWELVKEFKAMVAALHQAGIEVILDVIYNHTTEGGHDGPLYSFKGIDNSSYYLLNSDMTQYINDAGTGNVMRTSYKMVRKMVLDSLRYWVTEMHVDGFRFDLASIFTRNDDATINLTNPPILEEISMDPILASTRLIAEPWDLNTYQLGFRFPGANWLQWNGDYRDVIRRFVKGDTGMVAATMTRLYGSPDLFPPEAPFYDKPWQSVNFINSHDGFSLYDLVAYNQKHNEANGHNNTDGSDSNFSWNCGWEGDNNVPADVMTLRKQQAKNFITLLMLSNGIPMFRMGDEFLQTQQGNNNPFNQDNAISWLDWTRLTTFADVFRFFKEVIALRKAHPSFCRGSYWQSDVQWFGVSGNTDISFNSHTLAFYLDGKKENDDDFYILVNSYWQPLSYTIEKPAPDWKIIIDTAAPSPGDITTFSNSNTLQGNQYNVQARSIVVLQRQRS